MMGSLKNEATEVNGDERHSVINTRSQFSTDMVFKSREELKHWVQNVGKSLGYIIVTKRSKMNNVMLRCDRGGVYESKKKVSTKTTFSKKIDCPFRLAGKYSKRNDFWTLRVICDKHNHEPAVHIECHPFARRLSNEETCLVEDLIKKNVKPMDILSKLKEQNKDNVSTLKTIYNARNKFLKKLKEKVPSETMVFDTTDVHTIDEILRNNYVEPPLEEPFREGCLNKSNVLENYEPLIHGSCVCSYINQFPNMFERYITEVQNVQSDGNCGFRAIAVCLGFNEDAWPTVRSDLMDELNAHKTDYDEIFGRKSRLQLHDSLNFFRTDIVASLEHWMTMPEMGILIASRYNVILHCLSVGDSMTYLPLWSTPPAWFEHVAITIGHVNDNHYVKLTLEGAYPMPPIVPHWTDYRHECASAWISPYIRRLNMYTECYHSHCKFISITKDT